MEYTVKQLGNLAGVSGRTLRYYDQINLLKPKDVNEAGYRIYGSVEVDRLQQILFYRELGVNLQTIKNLLDSPKFNERETLEKHHAQLLKKRKQLDLIIQNVERTIAAKERGRKMSDQEKFLGLKQKLVRKNEANYGEEIREKYGDSVVDASNAKLLELTEVEYARAEVLAQKIIAALVDVVDKEDPAGEKGQQIAELHREWLSFYWPKYSKEAHAGLVEMYVVDERFKTYYDQQVNY